MSLIEYKKPNIRRWFKTAPGWEIWEVDLQSADAQVVAWDAHDEPLMDFFRYLATITLPEEHSSQCECLHCFNCMTIFGKWTKQNRFLAKKGVHAANYDVSPYTLAKSLGITVKEANDFLRRWFIAHPAIQNWQKRIRASITSTRSVRNAFGYRKIWHGRADDHAFKEGYSWIPQSTVAKVINRGMKKVEDEVPKTLAFLHMQVHDSLVGASRADARPEVKVRILEATRVEVPYPEPLVIGRDFKAGPTWGEVE